MPTVYFYLNCHKHLLLCQCCMSCRSQLKLLKCNLQVIISAKNLHFLDHPIICMDFFGVWSCYFYLWHQYDTLKMPNSYKPVVQSQSHVLHVEFVVSSHWNQIIVNEFIHKLISFELINRSATVRTFYV